MNGLSKTNIDTFLCTDDVYCLGEPTWKLQTVEKASLDTQARRISHPDDPRRQLKRYQNVRKTASVKLSDIPHPFDPRRKKLLEKKQQVEVIRLSNDTDDDLRSSIDSVEVIHEYCHKGPLLRNPYYQKPDEQPARWFRLDIDLTQWPREKSFSVCYHDEIQRDSEQTEDGIASRLQSEVIEDSSSVSSSVDVWTRSVSSGYFNSATCRTIDLTINRIKRKRLKSIIQLNGRIDRKRPRTLRTTLTVKNLEALRTFLKKGEPENICSLWNLLKNVKFRIYTMRPLPTLGPVRAVMIASEVFWVNRNNRWKELPVIEDSPRVRSENEPESYKKDNLEPLCVSDIAKPQNDRLQAEFSETLDVVPQSLTPIDWKHQLLNVFPLLKNNSSPSGQKNLSMVEKSPRRTARNCTSSGNSVSPMKTPEKNHAEKENLQTKNNSSSKKKKSMSPRRTTQPPTTPLAKPQGSSKRRHSLGSQSKHSSKSTLKKSMTSKHRDSPTKKSASRMLFKTTMSPRWKCESSLNKLVLKKENSESMASNFENINKRESILRNDHKLQNGSKKRIKFSDLMENIEMKEKKEVCSDAKTLLESKITLEKIQDRHIIDRPTEKSEVPMEPKAKRPKKEISPHKKRTTSTSKSVSKSRESDKIVPDLDCAKQGPIIVRIETPKIKINWISHKQTRSKENAAEQCKIISSHQNISFSNDEPEDIEDEALNSESDSESKLEIDTEMVTTEIPAVDYTLDTDTRVDTDADVEMESKLETLSNNSEPIQSNVAENEEITKESILDVSKPKQLPTSSLSESEEVILTETQMDFSLKSETETVLADKLEVITNKPAVEEMRAEPVSVQLPLLESVLVSSEAERVFETENCAIHSKEGAIETTPETPKRMDLGTDELVLDSQTSESVGVVSEKSIPNETDRIYAAIHDRLLELTVDDKPSINDTTPTSDVPDLQEKTVTPVPNRNARIVNHKKEKASTKAKKRKKEKKSDHSDKSSTKKKRKPDGKYSFILDKEFIYNNTEVVDAFEPRDKQTEEMLSRKRDAHFDSTDSGFFSEVTSKMSSDEAHSTADRVTPDSTEPTSISFSKILEVKRLNKKIEKLDENLIRKKRDLQDVYSPNKSTYLPKKMSQLIIAENPKAKGSEIQEAVLPDSSTNFADDLEGDLEVLAMLNTMRKTNNESDDAEECASNASSEPDILLHKSKADSVSIPNFLEATDCKSTINVSENKDELCITRIKELISVNKVKEECKVDDSAKNPSYNALGMTDIAAVQDTRQAETGIIKDSSKNTVSPCDIKSTIDVNNKFRPAVICKKENSIINGAGSVCTLSTDNIDIIDLSDDDENYKECQSISYSNSDCEIILDNLPKIGLNNKLVHNILRRPKVELVKLETDDDFVTERLKARESSVLFVNKEATGEKEGLLKNLESHRTESSTDVANKEILIRVEPEISPADSMKNAHSGKDRVVDIPGNTANNVLSCLPGRELASSVSGELPATKVVDDLPSSVVNKLGVTTNKPTSEERREPAATISTLESLPITSETKKVVEPESRTIQPPRETIATPTNNELLSASVSIESHVRPLDPKVDDTRVQVPISKNTNMSDLLQRLNINIVSIEDGCKQEIPETLPDEVEEDSDWLSKFDITSSEKPSDFIEAPPLPQPRLRVRSLEELGGTRWHSPTDLEPPANPTRTNEPETPLLNELLSRPISASQSSSRSESATSHNGNIRPDSLPGAASVQRAPSVGPSRASGTAGTPPSVAGSTGSVFASPKPVSNTNVNLIRSGISPNTEIRSANRRRSTEMERARATPQPETYLQTPSAFTPVQSHIPLTNLGQIMSAYNLRQEPSPYFPLMAPRVPFSPNPSVEALQHYNTHPMFRPPMSGPSNTSNNNHCMPVPATEDGMHHPPLDVIANNILKICGPVPNIRCASELYGNVISRAQTPSHMPTPPVQKECRTNPIRLLAHCIHYLQPGEIALRHATKLITYSTLEADTFKVQKHLALLVECLDYLNRLHQIKSRDGVEEIIIAGVNKMLPNKTTFEELNGFCNVWEILKKMNFMAPKNPVVSQINADTTPGQMTPAQLQEISKQIAAYKAINKQRLELILRYLAEREATNLPAGPVTCERSQPVANANVGLSMTNSNLTIRRVQPRLSDGERNRISVSPVQAEENISPEYKSCVMCNKTSTIACAKCKLVPYCSKSCQRQHWESKHHLDCKLSE